MGKRDKEIPYEVVIQERKRVDLYGNVVYYIYWFDKYGYNITNEWKFWSKENKAFILGTRKTGCDMIVLGGTNCSGSNMDWLFGCLGNENFYVCQPVSFYKSQQEIQKVNPLYAFKVATAYFREQGKVPVFEDSNCRLIKL